MHGREDEGLGRKAAEYRVAGPPEVSFDEQPPLWDKECAPAFVLPGRQGREASRRGSLPSLCGQNEVTYKLLFCVLQEEPEKLEFFHGETLASVAAFDSLYGIDLVFALSTYLGNDALTVKTTADLFAPTIPFATISTALGS